MQIVFNPAMTLCAGPAYRATYAITVPDRTGLNAFRVTIVNNTSDRPPTTDVFEVPATQLTEIQPDTMVGRTTGSSANTSGDVVTRSSGGQLRVEGSAGVCGGKVVGIRQIADQEIEVEREVPYSSGPCVGMAVAFRLTVNLVPSSQASKPLVVHTGSGEGTVTLAPVGGRGS